MVGRENLQANIANFANGTKIFFQRKKTTKKSPDRLIGFIELLPHDFRPVRSRPIAQFPINFLSDSPCSVIAYSTKGGNPLCRVRFINFQLRMLSASRTGDIQLKRLSGGLDRERPEMFGCTGSLISHPIKHHARRGQCQSADCCHRSV